MTIWTPSTIRNRPGQSLEVHTMGAPVVYWIEVIKPGEPHNGQANTATKLGANASRRWANSSRKTMSPGAIPESDARSEICRSVGSGSSPAEFGTRCAPSRPGTRPNLRDLSWCFDTALRDPSCQNAGRKSVPIWLPLGQKAPRFPAQIACRSGVLTNFPSPSGPERTCQGRKRCQIGTLVPIREKVSKSEFQGRKAPIL